MADETRQRIVVGIDGSDNAPAALLWALAEAAARGADLEVLTAFPVDVYWLDPDLLDDRRIDAIRADTAARARATVDQVRRDTAVADLPGVGDIAVDMVVAAGAPAEHLVNRSAGAALLVVGSRGRGAVRSPVAGSVALHCAAHARCPVVVVHPAAQPPSGPARVVVGLDDSDQGREALVDGIEQARRYGAGVDAVIAYEPLVPWSEVYSGLVPPVEEIRRLAQQRGDAIVVDVLGTSTADQDVVRVRAVEGDPREVLVREAIGAQLLSSVAAAAASWAGSCSARSRCTAPCTPPARSWSAAPHRPSGTAPLRKRPLHRPRQPADRRHGRPRPERGGVAWSDSDAPARRSGSAEGQVTHRAAGAQPTHAIGEVVQRCWSGTGSGHVGLLTAEPSSPACWSALCCWAPAPPRRPVGRPRRRRAPAGLQVQEPRHSLTAGPGRRHAG